MTHKLDGYVNVVSRLCTQPNCTTHALFGKPGTKTQTHCKRHRPNGYIDVVTKRCVYPECTTHDKVIPDGCSKRRPDFIIYQNNYTIVLEVDEFQHQRKSYACECEITRMKQIYYDIGLENCKLLFIRYNPDDYKPVYGNVFATVQRLDLTKYLNNVPHLKSDINVLYLFYDGFTQLAPETEYLDPHNAPGKIKIAIRKKSPLSNDLSKSNAPPECILDTSTSNNTLGKQPLLIKIKPKLK